MVWFDSKLIKWLTLSLERHGEKKKHCSNLIDLFIYLFSRREQNRTFVYRWCEVIICSNLWALFCKLKVQKTIRVQAKRIKDTKTEKIKKAFVRSGGVSMCVCMLMRLSNIFCVCETYFFTLNKAFTTPWLSNTLPTRPLIFGIWSHVLELKQ